MNRILLAVAVAGGVSVAGVGVAGAQGLSGGLAQIGPRTSSHVLYVGADYDFLELAVSNSSASGHIAEGHYFGRLLDFRAGYRVLNALAVEVHAGVNASGSARNHFGFGHYYAAFAVPTATVLNTVELSVPLGYVWSGAHARGGKATFNSVAFGANLEFPLEVLFPSLPDLRLTGGGLVSVQRSNAQIYGFHVGLRYDFGLGGLKPLNAYFNQ